ncbi:flagellar brake protein [Inmirania thermothiophila]|uniref:C-di-GMP-binding flagellar brake protein YcgR n=1 Tax=Inmirania thermothiophila TaxID=1750597 RepID=A0A3N1YB73_9GAMM|nr:PilZ domain-containing protein [Inmirania thermothiophila]ROR34902.1 c-di-GMP-binding flagellar brake protein YcgR [Inmirania thermothiophila]
MAQPHVHTLEVTSPARIAQLLARAQDDRRPLVLRFESEAAPRGGAVAAVRPLEEYFLVEGIRRAKGEPLPEPGRGVHCRIDHPGERIEFVARVREAAPMGGQVLVRIAFPDRLLHHQRRAWVRVPVAAVAEVPVTLVDAAEGSLFGRLEDLSLGGLGSLVLMAGRGEPADLATVEGCIVQLPDGGVFHAGLEVRNVHPRSDGTLRVGARFSRIPRGQDHRLERFIREVERELLRRQRQP